VQIFERRTEQDHYRPVRPFGAKDSEMFGSGFIADRLNATQILSPLCLARDRGRVQQEHDLLAGLRADVMVQAHHLGVCNLHKHLDANSKLPRATAPAMGRDFQKCLLGATAEPQ
jgi:hypothetical protein